MRMCIFCNKKANTREDAWPVWLMKRFPTTGNAYMEAERGGRKLGVWRAAKPRLRVKRVCASCNSGWMSRLENEAKPVLESILDDKVTSLGVSAQATLARWSVKTVMVLEAIDSSRPWFYSEGDRQSMYAALSLPARTSVWIAKCIDLPIICDSEARDLRTFPGKDEVHAFANTLVFGSLAIQVLSMKTPTTIPANIAITYDVRGGPWDQKLVPVWPTSQNSQTWPPRYGLADESELDKLAARFSPESQ